MKLGQMTDPFTCKNGCDLTYEVDGKKYSRIVFHKLLGAGVDHWDCPNCDDNCGVNWRRDHDNR